MKKIIFTLLALVGTMSMNAQVMKVMKNGQVIPVETYNGSDYYVVFEEAPANTGTAKRTGDIDVNWVQLWAGGPKFAEYNVGANSATDYGGYYCWGSTYKNGNGIEWNDDHNTGTEALSSDNDTATKLWGRNWRMPTEREFTDLFFYCDVQWTTFGGLNGCKFTGKGDYSSNSVFLPAAGYYGEYGLGATGNYGYYWSSTPRGSSYSYALNFESDDCWTDYSDRPYGCSVRAVLKETPTTGVAKATIGGCQVEVNWVQLWEDGPKFAEYNVGASSVTETGTTMTFADAIKKYSDYVWGSNWCTPSKGDMEHLVAAANGEADEKVKCEYTQENSVWGFKFTGLTDGYTDNSVFFPAQSGDSDSGSAGYWSATADGSNAWYVDLYCGYGDWMSYWSSCYQFNKYLVRPVLQN